MIQIDANSKYELVIRFFFASRHDINN